MGRAIFESIADSENGAELINLADWDLPLCDGDRCYKHPDVITLTERVRRAGALIVATPIYNFSVNAAAKNFLELTGKAWTQKVVGLLCSAGGPGSYMSAMPFANSLMLDFRCIIIPRFVYATGSVFKNGQIDDHALHERLSELARTVPAVARALESLTNT